MAFFIVTGKLRSGKSLLATARMRDRLLDGRRVATNFDLHLEHMLPVDARKVDCIRLPDLPTVADFEALGKGSEGDYNESNFGLIVIDEGSGNFNSRDWADKGRQAVIDWLKHSGKLRWDVYIIVQNENMLDKQIREAFGEHLVICKRSDRMSIPFVSSITKLLGFELRPPKIHVGVVRYGLRSTDPVVDRWMYRAHNLYAAYNTEQKFDRETSPGLFSYLPPYTIKGRYMNKFQIARAIAGTYVMGALLVGICLSYTVAWWQFKASHNSVLQNGLESAKAFSPKSLDETVSVDGYITGADGRVSVIYLSDGRTLTNPEYQWVREGLRVKVGEKWVLKRGA